MSGACFGATEDGVGALGDIEDGTLSVDDGGCSNGDGGDDEEEGKNTGHFRFFLGFLWLLRLLW